MYARASATVYYYIKDYFLWDTDGITFEIDNSETAIISSQCRLFTGPLVPASETLDIEEGLTTTTKLVGNMKLIQTDDANEHQLYVIPHCVFDPNTPLIILGVPDLGALFGDIADANDPLSEDGTIITLGATK